ncbi:uncharacterized protein LOC132715356 [Ruditapes philippinarum]|uniref:uncharacterized protein LOC132715356 n=1 Tax=Ruditapes philippinarum TaxID=129788 RepID=UPI00295C0D71|nr:uncharacterized protein LOC132715356 [Ruditapes philippinarum]
MRELLTGKKPSVEACPEDDLMTQIEKKIRKRLMKMWKDLQVVPEVTGPLVTLSSECIENEEMTSDKLVSELKNHLRNSNTQRWISRKQLKDVIQQGKGSKQTEKCDICLAYDAVEESVFKHHDCIISHKCLCFMYEEFILQSIHCHSCDTKVTPTIGHNWAALLIAGYDTRDWVAKSFKEDVKAIEQVISSKCPLVMGVSTSNMQTVCPEEKGKPDNMLEKLKTSKEVLKGIKGVQTLLVYYSGHYKPDEGGFQLVHSKEGETGIQNEEQYLSAEDFQEVISEILYGCESAVESKRTIVFLDCCAGPVILPTKENKSIPTSSGDTSQNEKLPCFTLSKNVRIVQINACRPDQFSVVQQGGSLFRKYLIQCLTREALGAKCLIESCYQCKIKGDFITIEKLIGYVGKHLDQHPKMEQYDPVMNSYNVSKLDAKIGYVVNFKVDLKFTLKLGEKIRYHMISQRMFTELQELQKLLFEKFVEKMELDKSIGDEPKLDTTELYGMICIEVEKIRQRDKITTLDQLMTAWNAKRELLVTLRAEAEIYNGMVGKFLPNGQSVDPILKYLEKSDHVTMAYKDYITVAKVDIVKYLENLPDDIHEEGTSLDTFDDHIVNIDNAMKQDKEEMKKVKELHIVFLCKIDENGKKIHRSNFICYQLKREKDFFKELQKQQEKTPQKHAIGKLNG